MEITAKMLWKKLPYDARIRYEDLVSYGWIGAIKAVDRFDPATRNSLNTFSQYRITGSMLDYIRQWTHTRRSRKYAAPIDIELTEKSVQKYYRKIRRVAL